MTSQTLGLLDLLGLFGYQISKRDKLVRHTEDAHDLFRRGWLEAYQAHQNLKVFNGGAKIISFVGLEGMQSRFFGVFDIGSVLPASKAVLPKGCPTNVSWRKTKHFYAIKRVPGFQALEDRVVINWTGGAINWHQYVMPVGTPPNNMPVVEVLAPGALLAPFIDYLDFTLTYGELTYLFDHVASNSEWRSRLQAVAGIYLILESRTGNQYVGSAGGVDGIWGRWSSYARNGHGGNALLQKLVAKGEGAPATFTFSILQVLPRTTARKELLRIEQRFKDKLGSRATGLNSN